MGSDIENKVEGFLNELEREGYETGAGLKEEANFSAIYDKYPGLFAEKAAAEAKALPPERCGDTLAAFLTVNMIDNLLKEKTDALLTKELDMTVECGGETVPLRMTQVLISNEPDAARRREMDAARRVAQLELNPLYEELHETTRGMVSEMGHGSYVDFFTALEGVDPRAVAAHTEKLLRETQSVYEAALDEYRERLLGIVKPAQCDMAFMRRAKQFDPMFPAERLVPSAWSTLSDMGIDATNNPHIRLDIEKRDKKSPRAFCSPVRVPEEIYLVIMPHGGVDDYASFFHELGHTLHFAHMDAALPVAARFLGDNSVTEAHAGLIERLPTNPRWLADALGVSDCREFIRFMDFFELYMMRRYSAKLHYELRLHGWRDALADCPSIYAKTLSEATLVEYSPDDYMRDVDPHFYCVRYLRSWMLERQMREYLEKTFGERWYASKDAGRALLELWSLGQLENAERISRRLGFDRLDMDTIIAHYSRGIGCE